MIKFGLDIGGVISKHPEFFRTFMECCPNSKIEFFIITDMHDKTEVMKMLNDNNIPINEDHVYCADYAKYGEMCKAILLKELGIDVFVDDFIGYADAWDSSLGPSPVRLLLMPDPYKPYWSDNWKCDGADFGRRKYKDNTEK